MATIGGGGGGRGREEEDGTGDGSGSKRPRLVIDLVDASDDEDEAGGSGEGSATAAAAAAAAAAASRAPVPWGDIEKLINQGPAPPAWRAAAAARPTNTINRVELPILPFYLGRVKKLESDEYNAQCLGLEDVIAGDFEKAILSNYMYEWEYIMQKVPRLLTVPCLACYGDEDTWTIQGAVPNIETFKPNIKSKYPWGTHHSKFALLWYATGLRVVITTANFIQIDFENKTEGTFVQDFPFLPEGAPDDQTAFGADLRDYLEQLDSWPNMSPIKLVDAPLKGHPKLKQAIIDLCRVDFSSAQAVLVASVPGAHKAASLGRYGHMRLRRLLEDEPIPTDVFLPPADSAQEFTGGFVSQFSSMASHARDGEWVWDEFEKSMLRARNPCLPSDPQLRRLRPHVVWPRLVDVTGSLEGIYAGGALPCPPKNVHQSPYPDAQSQVGGLATCHRYLQTRLSRFVAGRWGRQRAMPHFKSFLRYALHREPNGDGDGGTVMVPRLAWVLISSHNFSKSAWGVLQSRGEQLKIESFELGVLFLPSRYQRFERSFSLTPDHPLLGLSSPAHHRVQEGIRGFYSASCEDARRPSLPGLLPLPIPYALPPTPYAPSDVPWSAPIRRG